jgi:hypothetical protein
MTNLPECARARAGIGKPAVFDHHGLIRGGFGGQAGEQLAGINNRLHAAPPLFG